MGRETAVSLLTIFQSQNKPPKQTKSGAMQIDAVKKFLFKITALFIFIECKETQ